MNLYHSDELDPVISAFITSLPVAFSAMMYNQAGEPNLQVQLRFYYNEEAPDESEIYLAIMAVDEIIGYSETPLNSLSDAVVSMYKVFTELVNHGINAYRAKQDAEIEIFRDKLNGLI